MSARRPLRAPLAAALASAMLAAACDDTADRIDLPLVLETFEAGCGDLPCEWVPLEGSEGAVSRVRVIHDGVHALRLAGDGVGALGVARVDGLAASSGFGRGPAVVYTPPPWDDALGVQVTGRCDAGGSLDLTVVANAGLDAPGAAFPVPVAYRGAVAPTTSFAEPQRALMFPEAVDVAPPAGAVVLGADTVEIVKSGPGVCEVALLAVGAPPR